jgi:carbonic anhydrase/acetyltransferase-like protein (isoleucine patch superfamily)
MAGPLHLDPTLTKIDPTAFIATTAMLVGAVTIGQHSSVWFSAVLRGDLAPIIIGDNCSVQDGAVVHVDADNPTIIGNHVTLGHGAIVHGCEIGDNVLVGIRAVVLSRARIGANTIIGAGALVTEGMQIPPNSLVVGVPGRLVKPLTLAHQDHLRFVWEEYVRLSQAYKQQRPELDRNAL